MEFRRFGSVFLNLNAVLYARLRRGEVEIGLAGGRDLVLDGDEAVAFLAWLLVATGRVDTVSESTRLQAEQLLAAAVASEARTWISKTLTFKEE